jgi:hypothetical protein
MEKKQQQEEEKQYNASYVREIYTDLRLNVTKTRG